MDRFVQEFGTPCSGNTPTNEPDTVMNYFDGNTVTGLWNYAQRFAMSDNFYGTGFGQSTPGALNLAVGNTYGATCGPAASVFNTSPCPAGVGVSQPGMPQPLGTGTVYADPDPFYDKCSKPGITAAMGGTNLGDLLSAQKIRWGWFEGGFASPGYVPGKPATDDPAKVCTGMHDNIGGTPVTDYTPHHEPFEYYASTANPQHQPPPSIAAIGGQDEANHQYDLTDFWAAADSGNQPAVSFLKAPKYQTAHPGFDRSDPLDEQPFLVDTLNHLQRLPSWKDTAVMIAYDDSGGFYDHQVGPIIRQSQTSLDAFSGKDQCGADPAKVPTDDKGNKEQVRCGLGPRLQLLVLSRYGKSNYVDNTLTEQASITRFIEDNWLGGKRIGNGSADATAGRLANMFDFKHPNDKQLILEPTTGEPVASSVVSSQQVGIPNQTDVFSVAANGAVQVAWVQGAGKWSGPIAISPPGLAPPGAQLAASPQFGVSNQTDVFFVDVNGAVRTLWVQGAGMWNGPLAITPDGSASPGGGLAASQQLGIPNQTDVFSLAAGGAVQVSWVQGAGKWSGPLAI
jgi:phospholipase C